MFWVIALLSLVFLVIIAYFLLSGIAATTGDMELIRSMNLRLEWIVNSSLAFHPGSWAKGPFGSYLLPVLFKPFKDDFRAICAKMRAPLRVLFWWGFHCLYGLMRVKGALAGSPRDLKALIGFQLLALRAA